jgi:Tol biopolymer transport system component
MIKAKCMSLCLFVSFCWLLSCSCNKKAVKDDEPQFAYQSYYCPAVYPSGSSPAMDKQVAFYFNGAGNFDSSGIYIYSQADREMRLVLGHVAAAGGIDFSADGKELTFFANQKVWKINLENGQTAMLAADSNGAYCVFPDWSPDGEKIAFGVDGGSRKGIWLMNPDGSKQELLIPLAEDPAWSPDGRKIYCQNYTTDFWTDTTFMEIYSYELSTKEIERLTYLRKDFAMEPTVSPSGDLVAFTVLERRKLPQIWMMDKNGQNPHLIAEDGCNPVFYSDSEILYAKVKQDDGRLWIINADGTNDQLFLE